MRKTRLNKTNETAKSSMNLGFWLARANRIGHITAPGEPSDEDLRIYLRYANHLRRLQTASGKSGLLLGGTPRIAEWCRQHALNITVMDFCAPLAQKLQLLHKDWGGLCTVIDDWLTTKQKTDSFCWAAGDGATNAVGSGRNVVRLFRQIRRLLEPGSIVILRHMVRPSPTPPIAEIVERAAGGHVRSLGALKHQVAQSLQSSFMEGIKLSEVRNAILAGGLLEHNADGHYPWSHEPLSALEYYAIEGASLCYPTLEELRNLTRSDFEELSISYGSYEMSELCPTIVYRTLKGRQRRYPALRGPETG
jgi:hypothetical protein